METKKMPDAAKIAEETILKNADAFFDVDFVKAQIAIMLAMKKYAVEIEDFIHQAYELIKTDNDENS